MRNKAISQVKIIRHGRQKIHRLYICNANKFEIKTMHTRNNFRQSEYNLYNFCHLFKKRKKNLIEKNISNLFQTNLYNMTNFFLYFSNIKYISLDYIFYTFFFFVFTYRKLISLFLYPLLPLLTANKRTRSIEEE